MRIPVRATVLLAASVLAVAVDDAPACGVTDHRSERYVSATVDANGDLRIVTSDHRIIRVRKERRPGAEPRERQTSFERPVVSPDGRAVGAAALYPNCCTSYDIPLKLVIYAGGQAHWFEPGLAVFDWHFVDGSRRVAFSSQTVHFACFEYWQLRDIDSEQKVASVDVPVACGQIPDPPKVDVPEWVRSNVSGIP